MATVHEPPPKVRTEDEPKLEPLGEPIAQDKESRRRDRFHASNSSPGSCRKEMMPQNGSLPRRRVVFHRGCLVLQR